MRELLANDTRTLQNANNQQCHDVIDAAFAKIQSHSREIDILERRSTDIRVSLSFSCLRARVARSMRLSSIRARFSAARLFKGAKLHCCVIFTV
jgi:hypothetical protein